MNLLPLTPQLSVCGQLQASDLPGLAALGYKAVVCNRPDHEEPGQPTMQDMRRAAEAVGLVYTALPIAGPPTQTNAANMAVLLATLPRPLVAYCKSGGRSKVVIALAGLMASPT